MGKLTLLLSADQGGSSQPIIEAHYQAAPPTKLSDSSEERGNKHRGLRDSGSLSVAAPAR